MQTIDILKTVCFLVPFQTNGIVKQERPPPIFITSPDIPTSIQQQQQDLNFYLNVNDPSNMSPTLNSPSTSTTTVGQYYTAQSQQQLQFQSADYNSLLINYNSPSSPSFPPNSFQ